MDVTDDIAVAFMRHFFLNNPHPVFACYPDGNIDPERMNPAAMQRQEECQRQSEQFLPLSHQEEVINCYQTGEQGLAITTHRDKLTKIDYVCSRELERVMVFFSADEREGDFKIMTNKFREQEKKLVMAELVGDLGVVNRRHFIDQLTLAVSGVQLGFANAIALIFLDVNNFKPLNDRYGHEMGNKALIKVADAVMRSVRKNQLVGRLGGDEFAALIPNTRGGAARDLLEEIAFRIRQNLDPPMRINSNSWTIGVSLGGAVYQSGDTRSADDFLHEADQAMYVNKQQRRGENITFLDSPFSSPFDKGMLF